MWIQTKRPPLASNSEYSSSTTILSALMLSAFVTSSDGLSDILEATDIIGRHYRFIQLLKVQNATVVRNADL